MMAQTSLDQGGSSEGGRRWLDSEYVLKIGWERSQGSFYTMCCGFALVINAMSTNHTDNAN